MGNVFPRDEVVKRLALADEVGVGRLDAMRSAAKIAARYSADPKVRSLCQSVLPVAGLLAETAVTLRHEEFQQLQTLSELPRPELDELLLSVDRFVAERSAIRISPGARERLLQRFGMFGIRLGIATFREQVPHAEYADVSGAGHMVAGDRNDLFSNAVIEFMERCR